MASFTDGKPRIATAQDVAMPWLGYRDGRCFRCNLCGEFILIGHSWQLVWTNGAVRTGNFLAHATCCDGGDPIAKMKALEDEGFKRFWFMQPGDRNPSHPETLAERDRPGNEQ